MNIIGSCDVSIRAEVSSLSDCGRFFTMLVNEGEVNGVRLLVPAECPAAAKRLAQ